MTEVYIFGWKIMEPVTALTDFITAFVCIISFLRLRTIFKSSIKGGLIIFYFLFTGLATFFAGLFSHALIHIVPFEYKMIGWTFSAIGILIMEISLSKILIKYYSESVGKILRIIAIIQFVLFIAAIIYKPSRTFETVQINASVGLIGLIFPMIIYLYKKTKAKGLNYYLYALIGSIFTGLIFNLKFSIHTYLNYHDISHLMMAFFIYLMYLGTKSLLRYDFQ